MGKARILRGDSQSWKKLQRRGCLHHSTGLEQAQVWGRDDPQGTQHVSNRVRNLSFSEAWDSNEAKNDYAVVVKMGKLSHRAGVCSSFHSGPRSLQ